MNILFVCTGNTCRSPMAEVIARDYFARKDISNKVISAGIQNIGGEPASTNAIAAVAEYGLDLKEHKNRLVNRMLVETSDKILTMTIAQRDLLRIAYYDVENIDEKVQTLSYCATGEDKDLEDPFFAELDVYRKTRDEIKDLIEKCNWGE